MKDLMKLIVNMSEEELENITLIDILRLYKPQIFEVLAIRQKMLLEALESKIVKKKIFGKRGAEVLRAELEDLEDYILDDRTIVIVKRLESGIEGVKEFIEFFNLYYSTFSYEIEEDEEILDEIKDFYRRYYESNYVRLHNGQPLIDLPERFIGRNFPGYYSLPQEVIERIEIDFRDYIFSTIPELPNKVVEKNIRDLAEFWFDTKYYDILLERWKAIEDLEGKIINSQTTEEDLVGYKLTIPQKVLIMHFLFSRHDIPERKNKSKVSLIRDLCEIKGTRNLYDAVLKPFETEDKNFRKEDLKIIIKYFDDLGLEDIVEEINKHKRK